MASARHLTLTFSLTWSLLSLAGPSPAQVASPADGSLPWQVALKLNLPPRGAPGERGGKAARRSCKPPVREALGITSLVPQYRLALTAAARPTFWFYVPYSFPSPSATFILRDAQEQEVYRAAVAINGKPGVIGVSLPDGVTPLEEGEKYQWEFDYWYECPQEYQVRGIGGKWHGWLERVEPPFSESQLEAASPRERLDLYARKGLWFETLTELALQYRQRPDDAQLQGDWKDLIQHEAVDLPAEIVSAPVVDCCTLNDE